MEVWIQGNLGAHDFVNAEYWNKNFDLVKLELPD